jgi:phosphorylcholine metabolism protein LicD
MDDNTRIQLELVSEVSTLLTAANIEHCLMGGWALDFLVGRVTRAHDDVDLFVWAKDIETIHHLLTTNGYAYNQDYPYPEDGTFFRKHEQ